MKTITLTCDKCGDRIERDRCKLAVEAGSLRNRWPVVDLCVNCASAFGVWLEDHDQAEDVDSGDVEVDGREKLA